MKIEELNIEELEEQLQSTAHLGEHIVKTTSGYRLVSKKSGKNLGDFTSLAAAKKHEREVQAFKHMKNEQKGNQNECI